MLSSTISKAQGGVVFKVYASFVTYLATTSWTVLDCLYMLDCVLDAGVIWNGWLFALYGGIVMFDGVYILTVKSSKFRWRGLGGVVSHFLPNSIPTVFASFHLHQSHFRRPRFTLISCLTARTLCVAYVGVIFRTIVLHNSLDVMLISNVMRVHRFQEQLLLPHLYNYESLWNSSFLVVWGGGNVYTENIAWSK